MKQAYFITGTDTDAGKTYVTTQLLRQANANHIKTAALKPVASGSHETPSGLRNSDALQLQTHMSMDFPYSAINPFCYAEAASPHLLASYQGHDSLCTKNILSSCHTVLNSDYELLLVEGVGGWNVPLNNTETTADLAHAFGFPIVLVVGMKLGCLNHSLLTWEHIHSQNLPIAGWIANCLDPSMQYLNENIETLTHRLQQAPLLTLRYQQPPDTLAPWIFS